MSKKIVTLSVFSVFSVIIRLSLFYPLQLPCLMKFSISNEEIEKGKYLLIAGGYKLSKRSN